MTALTGIQRISIPLQATSTGVITQAWQTGNGTIPYSNVIYSARFPAVGENVTAGLPLRDSWSIAFRTVTQTVPNNQVAFDVVSGGIELAVTGFVLYFQFELTLIYEFAYPNGDHTFMVVCDAGANNTYVYVDAVLRATRNISGDLVSGFRWRTKSKITGNNWQNWSSPMPGAAVCDIALSATQISGLHSTLMALPAS